MADTAATFYNVMDAQFGPATSSTTISNTTPNIAAVSSLKAVGDINPSLDLKVGDQVYTRVFTASGEQQSLRTTLVIDSVANGAKDRWPYLLAQKVNAERGTMLAAGTLGSDGSVTPAPGRNTVYAKTTGIVSVETTIDQVQAATNPAAAPGFVLTDVPKDLLLDSAGNRSIAVAGKTSVAGAKVVAQLLDSNNAVRAVATRDMPEAGEFVLNLAVTGAKAGTHSLVVTATNMADPSKVTQQTVSVTLRSPQTANAPASTAASGAQYAFPNGLASYVAGTKVSHKGKVFTCKPFPYSGYCRQWSASANGFEPGVGHAWSMAWTQD